MDQSHVITIDQEMENMNRQMEEPKLLHKFAGKRSCCIFRVPQCLVDINTKAYRPRIVSIGPYHHGNKDLEMIQQHKWRFVKDSIQKTGKSLGYFLNILVNMESDIRQCYSESIDHFNSNDLAKMMLLDGFFLIEYFRKVGNFGPKDQEDPIFGMAWVSPFLMRDILGIENQIPFFVLQKLFDESKTDDRTLPSVILKYFNYAIVRPKEVLLECENIKGKHLLDFFRKSFIKTKNKKVVAVKANEISDNSSLKLIQPATNITIAGVKFKANHKANSFLDIGFQNGVLLIPHINMDDFYSSFFFNCVAFEQCYTHCTKDFTSYIVFMGCLMKTSSDVSLLVESKIIDNYFGTDKEIAKFFNNVGKDVAFDIQHIYLSGLFVEVNDYCKNGLHVVWAGFKHRYFESPWAFISALAALMLLSLAFLQTFYTVFPYYHK